MASHAPSFVVERQREQLSSSSSTSSTSWRDGMAPQASERASEREREEGEREEGEREEGEREEGEREEGEVEGRGRGREMQR